MIFYFMIQEQGEPHKWIGSDRIFCLRFLQKGENYMTIAGQMQSDDGCCFKLGLQKWMPSTVLQERS